MKNALGIAIISLLFLALIAPVGAGEKNDQTNDKSEVADILTRYIDAAGGRQALEKLTSRVTQGKEVTDFTSGEHPSYESLSLEAHTRAPIDYYLEIWSDQGGRKEGFDGKAGWVKDKCGTRTDDNVGRGKLAFILNSQGPLLIESYFPDLKYAGTSTIDGKEVIVLQPASLPEAHYALYFSVDNGLLVRIGYYWSIEDYREVDGVMVPHRIRTSRKGGSTVYELDSIVHNVAMIDSLFKMPD